MNVIPTCPYKAMFSLIGERSSTKIAALFGSEEAARVAADEVKNAAGLGPDQARVLFPADASVSSRELFGRKLEPESAGIARTFWRTHAVFGFIGGAIGLLLWWLWSGHPFIVSTPIGSFIAFVGFGITFGLLLGGLITFRPDQVRVIELVRSGLRAGKWAVVFHPVNRKQAASIQNVLQARKVEVLSSF